MSCSPALPSRAAAVVFKLLVAALQLAVAVFKLLAAVLLSLLLTSMQDQRDHLLQCNGLLSISSLHICTIFMNDAYRYI